MTEREDDDQVDVRIFIGLVLGGAVVFALAVAIGAALDAEPGSQADWIAAVSTFVALLAASYAAIQTARTFGLEQKRDRQRDRDIRQQQAVQVAVWVSGPMPQIGQKIAHTWGPGDRVGTVTHSPGPTFPTSIPVTIRNTSDLPVFSLSVDLYAVDPADGALVLIQSHEYPTPVVDTIESYEIATPEFVEGMLRSLNEIPAATQGPLTYRVGWTFEDVSGRRWRRVPGSELEPYDA